MVNCCVPLCRSYTRRTKKIHAEGGERVSYHEFPSDLKLLAKWLNAIPRKDFVVNFNSNSSRVCNKHFKEEDFVRDVKRRRLKPGSIPSIFKEYTQASASCSARRSPQKGKQLDCSQVIKVQEKDPVISSIVETPTEPEHIHPLAAELRRKEFALEVKNKALKSKILEVRRLKKQLYRRSQKLIKISAQVEDKDKDLDYYNKNIHHQALKKLLEMESSGSIEPKQVFLLTQLKFMFAKAFRWPESILRECNLLQAASPQGYKTLERGLINLPSRSTLNRYTRSTFTEIGVILKADKRQTEDFS